MCVWLRVRWGGGGEIRICVWPGSVRGRGGGGGGTCMCGLGRFGGRYTHTHTQSTLLETRVLHFVEKELTRVGFLLVEQRRV